MLLALVLTAFSAEKASAAPCDPPIVNAIVCENSKPGNPPSEWDVNGVGRPDHPGLRHRHQRRSGPDGPLQGRYARHRLPPRHLPDGLLRRQRRAQGRHGPALGDPAADPAGLPQPGLDRADRLRQLGRVGLLGGPADRSLGDLLRQARPRRPGLRRKPHHLRRPRRRRPLGPALPDLRHDLAGLQPLRRQQPLRRAGPGPIRAAPTRSATTARSRSAAPPPKTRRSTPSTRWSAGWSATATTSATPPGSTPIAAAPRSSSTRSSSRSATTSTGRASQRANVEAARDAGVNLAFFSGNEIFWKTRWENSIDGSNTDHRTLVCYKETHANAKIDPDRPTWTGTWRDPRFSPPADGGRPENALTGTIFTVNSRHGRDPGPGRGRQDALLAQHERRLAGAEPDGDARRRTRSATSGTRSSTTASAPPAWSTSPRPPPPSPSSSSTTAPTTAPAPATHHLTLYRAASGALVFGAGTIQWSWGLDGNHDRGGSTADSRDAAGDGQPARRHGRAAGHASGGSGRPRPQTTDTPAPTTTITNPLAGAEVRSGTPVTISGTATDRSAGGGGGQVGGVEVSVDGGSLPGIRPSGATTGATRGRRAPSEARRSGLARPTTAATSRARAAQVDVEDRRHGPAPARSGTTTFTGPQDGGHRARSKSGSSSAPTSSGFITGLRFYKTAGNTGTHVGHLWTAGGTELGPGHFHRRDRRPAGSRSTSARRWRSTPIPPTSPPITRRTDTIPRSRVTSRSSASTARRCTRWPTGSTGPTASTSTGPRVRSSPGRDLRHSTRRTIWSTSSSTRAAPTPPRRRSSPAPPPSGATGVPTTSDVTATFNEAMDPSTISGSTVSLSGPGGVPVAATVTYSSAQQAVILRPDRVAAGLDHLQRNDQGRPRRRHRPGPTIRSQPIRPGPSPPRRRHRRLPTKVRAARSWLSRTPPTRSAATTPRSCAPRA